jgi:hypothetical protein
MVYGELVVLGVDKGKHSRRVVASFWNVCEYFC